MAGQGLKYNVDVVMCIDCTGSMGDLLDKVKANALKFTLTYAKNARRKVKMFLNSEFVQLHLGISA